MLKHVPSYTTVPYTITLSQLFLINADYAHIPPRTLVEIDSEKWHSSAEQIARDEQRQRYLEDQGNKVSRLTGKEVRNHIVRCVYCVKNHITARLS